MGASQTAVPQPAQCDGDSVERSLDAHGDRVSRQGYGGLVKTELAQQIAAAVRDID